MHELHRLVLDAIATLPTEQPQAVRRHFIEGLTLWEIGGLVGVPVGTIKAGCTGRELDYGGKWFKPWPIRQSRSRAPKRGFR
jgi:hypothetical protein